MAELKERPKRLRTVEVEVPGGRVLSGYDMNDVVRQILWDEREQNQWATTSETARYLGLQQQTLFSFFDEATDEDDDSEGESPRKGSGRGLNLRSLTRILIARTRGNPLQFFQKHPLFRSRAPQQLDVDHFSYDGLCSLLTPTQAQQLTRIVEALLDRPNGLNEFMTGTRALLGITEEAKPRTRKHKKTG